MFPLSGGMVPEYQREDIREAKKKKKKKKKRNTSPALKG
jgi:hypothetical protein